MASMSLLPASRKHIPALNGIRAISIGVVLFDHALPWKIIPGGFAVSIFFFISGFLITRLLLDEHRTSGSIDIRAFYISRALRLFPALAIALAFAVAVTGFLGYEHSILAVVSVAFYFANYVHALDVTQLKTIAMYQSWSLSVEEQFYLVYPLIALVALPSQRRLSTIIGCSILAAIALRAIYHVTFSNGAAGYIFSATETRMDFIAYGCLTAVICNSRKAADFVGFVARPSVILAACMAILLSLAVRDELFRDTFRYYLQGLSIFVLVPAAIFAERLAGVRSLLNLRAIDWIGRLSYSLYLFHPACLLIGAAVASKLDFAAPIQLALSIVLGIFLTFALATLSYYLIEKPALRFRSRLLKRDAPADSTKFRTQGIECSDSSLIKQAVAMRHRQ